MFKIILAFQVLWLFSCVPVEVPTVEGELDESSLSFEDKTIAKVGGSVESAVLSSEQSLYNQQCLSCHGDAQNKSDIYDLATICDECEKNDDELAKYIQATMPKGGIGSCDADCSSTLASYIKENIYKKRSIASIKEDVKVIKEEVKTKTGEEIYQGMCISCHGTKTVKTGVYDLVDKCDKCGDSIDELAEYISKTMPKGGIGSCDLECSKKVGQYIVDNLYTKPTTGEPPPSCIDGDLTPMSRELRRLSLKEFAESIYSHPEYYAYYKDISTHTKKVSNKGQWEKLINTLSSDNRKSGKSPFINFFDSSELDEIFKITDISSDAMTHGASLYLKGMHCFVGRKLETFLKFDKDGEPIYDSDGKQKTYNAYVYNYKDSKDIDKACIDSFSEKLGKLIIRRPVPESMKDIAWEIFSSTELSSGTTKDKIEAVSRYFYKSPFFVFHLELGEGADKSDSNGEKYYKLSAHELANRVSFGITSGQPDSALLADADNGEILKEAILESHADRLIASAKGRAGVKKFFNYWLDIEKGYALGSLAGNFLGKDTPFHINNYPGYLYIENSYQAEIFNFINYIVFGDFHATSKKQSFKDLYTSRKIFATGNALHAYGLTDTNAWDGSTDHLDSPDPDYKGLFTRPATTVTNRLPTPIIVRGVHLLKDALCTTLPLPDFTDVAARMDAEMLLPETNTNRDVVHNMTKGPKCALCHDEINPYGFILERFDPVGRLRNKDIFYDKETPGYFGKFVPGTPMDLDTSVTINLDGKDQNVSGPSDFMELLASSNEGKSCFEQKYFEFVNFRDKENADACYIHKKVKTIDSMSVYDFFKSHFVGLQNMHNKIRK